MVRITRVSHLTRLGLIGSSAVFWLAVAVPASTSADQPLPAKVDFNRDIRPILSDICFHCHGPDKNQRQADLRFDNKQGAFADRDGSRAIVPGDLSNSELYQRIIATDPDERMPPADADRKLNRRQKCLPR
ncbi:hypothetical protein IIB79_03995 [candidate division KSB1 bacterium]|nr:hypothetical protein [candidate division KSB1 bacterium]